MKIILIRLIEIYRKYVSVLKTPSCRFYPTCSQYAIDAIKKYGAVKGTCMAIWRIIRCNPFNKGGNDPVK